MSEVATALAQRIASTREPFGADDDDLLLAQEIIAKVRMNGFKPSHPLIEREEFDEQDVVMLRNALVDYASTFPDHPTRGTAYWGLAALFDQNERELFRGFLEIESTKELLDEDVLWQVMIALDNIGEDVLKPLEESSVEKAGDRWAASRLYLSRNA